MAHGVGSIVVACVGENSPKYLSRSLRLVQSLRWNGGSIANSDVVLCFVDDVDAPYRAEFERLGASVRIVKRFHSVSPPANKLRVFEIPEVAAYDTVMLLDTDTIILQDPTNHLTPGVLQARMAGYATVSTSAFRKVFAHFGLSFPAEDQRCSVSGAATIWYCNTGVVVLPAALVRDWAPLWLRSTSELCDQPELIREVGGFFAEQAGFVVAYFRHSVPFALLPLELNCPVPKDEHVVDAIMSCDPVILHYHDRVDSTGLLIANANPNTSRRVAEFNARSRQEWPIRDVPR